MRLALPTEADFAADAARRRQAAREQLDQDDDAIRERCGTLMGFIREFWPILEPKQKFADGWVLWAMADHLEAVTRGEIQHLLINVPPGFMKSLMVSVFWPAWEWGPQGLATMRYLTTSYAEPNVIRDNLKMRRIVESEKFQRLWPEVKFSRDQNAKTKFENTKTGGREGRAFIAMTGGRGDRVLIDDPHSTTSAESDVQRLETIKTFRESIPDRTNNETSSIVVIMQRLHEGDVSGTILKLGMDFVHLCLPMEFEPDRRCVTKIGFADPRQAPGELLFPERFGAEYVRKMKIAKGAYAYAGQYQQRPAPREGALFKISRIKVVKAIPAGYRKRVRAWDLAASEATALTDPDWTVGVKMSRGDEGDYLIEDVRRDRDTALAIRSMIGNTASQDGERVIIRFPQDPGQAGKDQAASFVRMLAGYVMRVVRPTGSKVVRADAFSVQVEAGNVSILEGAWNQEFLDELGTFPAGIHDDQVDAASDAFNEIAEIRPGENVLDYYRRESDEILARQAAQKPGEQLPGHDAGDDDGLTKMLPPEGVNVAYGMLGDVYRPGADGAFRVKEHDVGPLRGAGFLPVIRPD